MSSGQGNFSSVDERMLLTTLIKEDYISSLQADAEHYRALKWLHSYFTNTSTKETKGVLANGRLMPATTEGVVQVKGTRDTFDFMYDTIKHAIKWEYSEKEENDLKVSGAWEEIYSNIVEANINWFYEIVGKLWAAVTTGYISYMDEDGNFMGSEIVKGIDGEEIVQAVPRTSGRWYQNVDGNATTTKVDVAVNFDNAILSMAAIKAGHVHITMHRKPSENGNGASYINPLKYGLLVHKNNLVEAREILQTVSQYQNIDIETRDALPMYEIACVMFPKEDMWVQVTDKSTVGFAYFTGKLKHDRGAFPNFRLGDTNTETGKTTYYSEAELGMAASTPTGFFIHTPTPL